MEQCRVIAITNQKGGVGKTTTTVNLGVGLAKQGKQVLLIDADPQGSLTISLGERNPDQLSETLSNVMECVINDKSLPENFGLLRSTEGVDLMPANIELSGTEVGLFNVMSREYVLKSYIDSVSKNYDYILIDCMPSLGMMTINALAAADRVIIPSQPSFLSTKGLNQLMHSVAKVKRQINPRLNIDGILLTMVDNRTNNAKAISTALRAAVSDRVRVFDTQIPFSVRAAESAQEGQSIFAYLTETEQHNLLNSISYNDATPSLPQAIRLKEFSKAGKLSAEVIEAILGEEKPNQKEKISFKAERLRPYIPSTVPLEKTEDYIIKALEYYQRVQERKKREQAR